MVSTTCTTKVMGWLWLLLKSRAVHDTGVLPRLNWPPDAGVQVTTGLGSTGGLSVAVTVKVTTAPLAPVASTVMSGCWLTTGAVVSTTCTTKVIGWLWLLLKSRAVQDTGVLPRANWPPDAGVQVTTGFGSTGGLSVAVTVKLTTAPLAPVASTVMSACWATVGAMVSWTVTVNVIGALVLPALSVAVQDTVCGLPGI